MNLNFPTDKFAEKEQRQIFVSYWLRRIFIEDWLMKLLALGISLALWLGVSGLQEPATKTLYKVRLNTLISDEFVITNTPIDEIELALAGDKRRVNPLRGEDISATIDLTDILEGERTIQLTPQNIDVDLPNGVKINKIRPNKIAVSLEKVGEFDVAVKAETDGSVAKGFEVYSSKVTPEKVRVRGPKSFIESLNYVSTEKISVADKQGDFFVQQVAINVSDSKVSLVNTAAVSVAFRIGNKRMERLFVVSYEVENKKGNASVTLYGADSILENISNEEIFIVEDTTAKSGLRVRLPEDILSQVEVRNVKFRE